MLKPFRLLSTGRILIFIISFAPVLAACGSVDITPIPAPATPKPVSRQTAVDYSRAALSPTALPAASPTAAEAVIIPATVTPLSSPVPPAGTLPDGMAGTAGEEDSGLLDPEQDNISLPAAPAAGRNLTPYPPAAAVPTQRQLQNSPATTAKPALKANYGSNGNPKVGVQAGHWLMAEVPEELASLRNQTGGSGGGIREVDYNLDIARRVTKLLQAKGIEVDLLPATVPPGYTADAFIAIHADASAEGSGPGGYKLARSRFSAIPVTDDSLMNSLYSSYGQATNRRRDSNITRNMTGYYAFNNRRRTFVVSKNTPAVILEMGYLTNPDDAAYLAAHRDTVAQGIVSGITGFLANRPSLDKRERAAETVRGIEVVNNKAVITADPGGAVLTNAAKGQQFEYSEISGDYYAVFLPALNKRGYINRADVKPVTLPR